MNQYVKNKPLNHIIMLENEEVDIDYVRLNALPCPFCGEKPTVDKNFVPSTVDITCHNFKCHINPSVYENVKCIENEGNSVTYTPMFEWHWQSVLDKWNTRY